MDPSQKWRYEIAAAWLARQGSDFAASDLSAAAAGIEFGAGGAFGFFRDLNFIDDGTGTSGFGHAGGGAFVLDDVGFAFDGRDASAGGELESVFADFRFGEFCLDAGLDFSV